MKKILAYTLVAVLLGVVTMLAPLALFGPSPAEYMQTKSAETERTYGITPETYPLDVLFIAFMLTLSLVIALGVMRHFKRKTVF